MGYSPWGHEESDTTERLHDDDKYDRHGSRTDLVPSYKGGMLRSGNVGKVINMHCQNVSEKSKNIYTLTSHE